MILLIENAVLRANASKFRSGLMNLSDRIGGWIMGVANSFLKIILNIYLSNYEFLKWEESLAKKVSKSKKSLIDPEYSRWVKFLNKNRNKLCLINVTHSVTTNMRIWLIRFYFIGFNKSSFHSLWKTSFLANSCCMLW